MNQQEQMIKSHVVLVDEQDNEIGICDKYSSHRTSSGPRLHRAFSLFLFDQQGRLLLQRRSEKKLTFPLIWANTCCSHPEPKEDLIRAAIRRTKFELNIDIDESCNLTEVGVFQYKAESGEWTESEVDHVIFGFFNVETIPFNEEEVCEVKWVSQQDLSNMVNETPEILSPWLKKIYKQWLLPNWQSWITNKTLVVPKSDHVVKL